MHYHGACIPTKMWLMEVIKIQDHLQCEYEPCHINFDLTSGIWSYGVLMLCDTSHVKWVKTYKKAQSKQQVNNLKITWPIKRWQLTLPCNQYCISWKMSYG